MKTDFFSYNAFAKTKINQRLGSFLSKQSIISGQTFWKKDVAGRFKDFCSQGKAVRGTLVILAAEIFSDRKIPAAFPVAAALEIMHASLLIHDDFMDQDLLRRGKPTFVKQYSDILKNAKSHDSSGLAICAGDIGFFWGFKMLANDSKLSLIQKQKLIALFSEYMEEVGLAQMQDIWFGLPKHQPHSSQQILEMYRSKTGHYTFTLPLIAGAILSGQDNSKLNSRLRTLGGLLGLVFQIQDDLIDIYSDTKQTGKPAGSDISAGKHTLLYSYFLSSASSEQKKELRNLFGKGKTLTKPELNSIRKLFISSGCLAKTNKLIKSTNQKIIGLIDTLAISPSSKKILLSLSEYNLSRQK